MAKATEEQKRWFGDGEWDVDLMLSCGAVTEDQIIEMYNREHSDVPSAGQS
jgi:hypothetical protein